MRCRICITYKDGCPAMKFEHLVQINDLQNPMILPMSREELWRGLVLRVEQPQRFVSHLDACTLTEVRPEGVRRTLRYGEVEITDTATYLPQLQIHIEVPAQGQIQHAHMRMVIEEPQPGDLFVRFIYEDDAPEETEDQQKMINEFRCSAYREMDIEAVRIMRELFEKDALN